MFLPSLCALSALLVIAPTSQAFIAETVEVIILGKKIVENVQSALEFVDTFREERPETKEQDVMARLEQISRDINRVELAVSPNAIAMMLAKSVGKGAGLELRLHDIKDLLNRVTEADRQMQEYVRRRQQLEHSTLEDFAQFCVSHDPGALPGLLERIHSLIVPPQKNLLGKGLLELVLEELDQGHPDMCGFQMSQHQLILDMYNTITLTEIKGYAMMQFAYMLLRVNGKGNFTTEVDLTSARYVERTAQTAEAVRAALAVAKRNLYRCDPDQHVEGRTYAKVNVKKAQIINEVNLNKDGSCSGSCGDYHSISHGCYEGDCSRLKTCEDGSFYSNCQYIDANVRICPAARNSDRLYEWIKFGNGRTLGHGRHCNFGTTRLESWTRWLVQECSYCLCWCDKPESTKNNAFSLRAAVSNIRQNKVVTGVRLVKHGRVFHLQVSEGTLGERGAVAHEAWVPVNWFDPSDYGVNEDDYHTVNAFHPSIKLNMVDSPTGRVLTGVRFLKDFLSFLGLEIRYTPFNFTTGRLSPQKSQWLADEDQYMDTETLLDSNRWQPLELRNPDIPTRGNIPHSLDSHHDHFVSFTGSDLDADAGQNTVPFVDIQPVVPTGGSSLLTGAGLIHRGRPGSGGFFGLKVITYDYSSHVHAPLPPATPATLATTVTPATPATPATTVTPAA